MAAEGIMTAADEVLSRFLMHKTTGCANLECSNKSVEGAHTVVLTRSRTVVGGHRGITLFLCSPCANALTDDKE